MIGALDHQAARARRWQLGRGIDAACIPAAKIESDWYVVGRCKVQRMEINLLRQSVSE